MSYKIKSLIYLSCFVVAALLYNNMEEETENKDQASVEVDNVIPQYDDEEKMAATTFNELD